VGNGSVVVPSNLTVGGVSFASLNFTAVQPLQKVVNLQTGAVELRVDSTQLNPFWCAGKVGSTGNVLANIGRVSFTATRTSLGQWTVTFATPHPSANNVVVITSHGYTYLSSSTATGFGLVLKKFDFALADAPFHFTVLA
jgi:hypothetical protein